MLLGAQHRYQNGSEAEPAVDYGETIFSDVKFPRTSSDHIALVLNQLWRRGLLVDPDLVLVTGLTYPHIGNTGTNPEDI